MLGADEIGAHLARLSYKPNWRFYAYQGAWEGTHVVIEAGLPDTRNPGQTAIFRVECFPDPILSTEHLELWLAKRLARIEIHEMREFLRRDGEVLFDPHTEFAERDLS